MDIRQPVSADEVIAALGVVQRFLTEEELRAPRGQRASATWRGFLRQAAAAGARLLSAEPDLFPGLRFTAEELGADPPRLLELERAREALAVSLAQVDRAILLCKGRMAQRTRLLHDAVGHKLADRSLEPQVHERLWRASLGLRRAFGSFAARQEAQRQRTLRRNARLGALMAPGEAPAAPGEPGGAAAQPPVEWCEAVVEPAGAGLLGAARPAE